MERQLRARSTLKRGTRRLHAWDSLPFAHGTLASSSRAPPLACLALAHRLVYSAHGRLPFVC